MNHEVFITCALTGAGNTTVKSNLVPVTPQQIAESGILAAKAGAAVIHIHVRDPQSGAPSRDPELYREVVDRVQQSGVNVVINLTAGMGGDLVLGAPDKPLPLVEEQTDMASAEERLRHVELIRPEICTLDCGTMNFAEGDYIMVNTTSMLRDMAGRIRDLGIRPELEVFDTGHLMFANQLIQDGLVNEPALFQLCMGIPYGAPDDPQTLLAFVNNLPKGSIFSAFSIGRMQLPYVAMSALAGGNVRVGLEDNIYLSRGKLATNEELVSRAVTILETMNCSVLTPDQVRERLQLN